MYRLLLTFPDRSSQGQMNSVGPVAEAEKRCLSSWASTKFAREWSLKVSTVFKYRPAFRSERSYKCVLTYDGVELVLFLSTGLHLGPRGVVSVY